MTAPAKNEPGTTVATQPKAAPGDALDRVGRQHLADVKARRALTIALNNEAWGQALTPRMQSAVAEYMRRHKLDVSEVDVLGGKIYRNGYYYRRRIAEMRAAGKIDWSEQDMVGPNPQLDVAMSDPDPEVAAWAKAERFRRLRERTRFDAPPDATHVCIARVKTKNDAKVLEGADWITPERLKKTKWGEKIADPVGAEEPEKTVITRAWRRCGLLVAAEIPELRAEEDAMKADEAIVDAQLEEMTEEDKQRELANQREPQYLTAPAQDDPYGPPVAVPRQPEPVVSDVGEERSQSQSAPASATPPASEPAAPAGPSLDQLLGSINKLVKHERVTDGQRRRFVDQAAAAVDVEDLQEVIGKLEKIIAGTV